VRGLVGCWSDSILAKNEDDENSRATRPPRSREFCTTIPPIADIAKVVMGQSRRPDVLFQPDRNRITDIALSQEDDFAGCSGFKYLFVCARRVAEW
jgi:hypothetical protein